MTAIAGSLRNLPQIILKGCLLLLFMLVLPLNAYPQLKERAFIHYTNNEGLPYSAINDILQDNEGFMWITTRMSVCRFDGYEFNEIKVYDLDNNETYLRTPKLFKDFSGTIYILTFDTKLFRYNPVLNSFKQCRVNLDGYNQEQFQPADSGGFWALRGNHIDFIPESADTVISNNSLSMLNNEFKDDIIPICFAVNNEYIYVLAGKNVLYKFNPGNRQKIVTSLDLDKSVNITGIKVDESERLWLKDQQNGLFYIKPGEGSIIHFSSSSADENRRIPHNMVRGITEDNDGNIWLGTEYGLAIWHPSDDSLEILQFDEKNPAGINSNAIYCIYSDRNRDIWIGTYFGGINLWCSEPEFFNTLAYGSGEKRLGGKEVRVISEDRKGNIWIGLEGAGVNIIDFNSGEIESFRHVPGTNSLSYDNVHSFAFDRYGTVYIGTYTGGLNILEPNAGKFSYINTENTSIQSNNIYSLILYGDSLLIGTEGGMSVLNIKSRVLSQFIPDILNGYMIECLHYFQGKIWISTRSDLFVYDLKKDTIDLVNYSTDRVGISFLSSDSEGHIWIGDSYNGLFRYNPEDGTTTHFKPGVDLPSSRILGILEGKDGWYWISASNGLIRFKPETGDYIRYTTASGLPFSQFNFNAFFKDSHDNLYFGGINGLIYFNEGREITFRKPEGIVFSRLQLSGKDIEPGTSSAIKGTLNSDREVILTYRQNNFTIFYSGLNFVHPGRTQYSYRLDGLNQNWVYAGNNTSATYTNLAPGKYYFRVKSGNENYEWSQSESVLKIVIKPPFWRTSVAFIVYGLLFLAGLFIFYLISIKVEKANARALLERKEKEHQQRLSLLKAEFFTNIAHELRTPLTLIISPLVTLLKTNKVDNSFWEKLRNINENSRRLLSLINQLLEFRRVESGKEILRVCEGDINSFIRDIADAFSDLAEIRNIDLKVITETHGQTWFDHFKIERVLFNLLSNAFKYTRDGGRITLRVSTTSTEIQAPSESLRFEIEDTGVGISEELIGKIFDEYTSVSGKGYNEYGSSGIGLHFAKSLVSLHKGELWVKSQKGTGSVFIFTIPCGSTAYSEEEKLKTNCDFLPGTEEMVRFEMQHPAEAVSGDFYEDKQTILIVEDDESLLKFLAEQLGEDYNVIPQKEGVSALKCVAENSIDLVITDIMMPEMDGIELTNRLKSDIATSHIPVILLSSRTLPDEKLEGLTAGADFYIEKPFYPQILAKHISNILNTRRRIIDQFRHDIKLPPAEIAFTKADKDFIDEVTAVIMNNLDNSELDVSFLLSKLHISRTLLHLKLKKIAQCSATGFIRIIRLREAAKMISEEGKTISEAAWLTGFSSPAFFSRRFKEHFGQSPKEYFMK